MSRLESEKDFEFTIDKTTADESVAPSFPLQDRSDAIKQFDLESQEVEGDRQVTVPLAGDLAKILESASTLYQAADFIQAAL